jgi:hypothetical protein
MPISLRGLRTVRTLAGRVNRAFVPHRAHLQIACLEIEKARRNAERTSACRRVAELDARLRAIEAEEASLLARLGQSPKHVDLREGGVRLAPPRTAGALRIRY